MKVIGSKIIHFDQIHSTNEYASELLSKSNPLDGTVISADFQSEGKGQRERKWYSSVGENLLMSVIVYPKFLALERIDLLSKFALASIIEIIEDILKEKVAIKLPNDLYFREKKICGVLIENSISKEKVDSTIIGIGININQTKFNEEIKAATSLALETNRTFVVENLKNEMIESLNKHYFLLKKGQYDLIDALFDSRVTTKEPEFSKK